MKDIVSVNLSAILRKHSYVWSLVFFTILSCLPGCQCEEDESPSPTPQAQLPAITTDGKNTFGCKVNGQVWLPSSKRSFPELFASVDRHKNYKVVIWGVINPHNIAEDIELGFTPDFNSLVYPLKADAGGGDGYAIYDNVTTNEYYKSNNTTHTGTLTLLKFDTVNHIIAGTFSFSAIDTAINKTVTVSEGRFDLRFDF